MLVLHFRLFIKKSPRFYLYIYISLTLHIFPDMFLSLTYVCFYSLSVRRAGYRGAIQCLQETPTPPWALTDSLRRWVFSSSSSPHHDHLQTSSCVPVVLCSSVSVSFCFGFIFHSWWSCISLFFLTHVAPLSSFLSLIFCCRLHSFSLWAPVQCWGNSAL